MTRRIPVWAAASLLVVVFAAVGVAVANAKTDAAHGACDVGIAPASYFSGGSANGVLTVKSDGSIHFVCHGTVPDLGLLTGAHRTHVLGTLSLTAGSTTVVAPVDCLVNTGANNSLTFVCTTSP